MQFLKEESEQRGATIIYVGVGHTHAPLSVHDVFAAISKSPKGARMPCQDMSFCTVGVVSACTVLTSRNMFAYQQALKFHNPAHHLASQSQTLQVQHGVSCLVHLSASTNSVMLLQATHIFDGLESWPSHVMYLAGGTMQLFKPAAEIPELQEGRLLQLVDRCATSSTMCMRRSVHSKLSCLAPCCSTCNLVGFRLMSQQTGSCCM